MSAMPEWRKKHPCTGCRTGYGACLSCLAHNLKCCADCSHPTRWTDKPPYTDAEFAEMRAAPQPESEGR